MPNFIDATGAKFGRLHVLRQEKDRITKAGNKRTRWACLCECGQSVVVDIAKLRNGHTQSCGCLHRERAGASMRTHGQRHTRAYNSWAGMKDRCLNVNSHKYHLYGARGISVDDRWRHSFEDFLADMGQPPLGHTLERNNPNGPYSKDNCRWATPLEQANNLRTVRRLTHSGVTQTITQWATQFGVKRDIIKLRLKRGWTFDEVVNDLQ